MRMISPAGRFLCFLSVIALCFNGCGESPGRPTSTADSGTSGESSPSQSASNASEARVNSIAEPATTVVSTKTKQHEPSRTKATPSPPSVIPSSIKVIRPIATVPAEKRLHNYHKTEAVFISHDGQLIAKQYSMPIESGMRYWIDLTDTLTGKVQSTIECKSRIWDGAFRSDNKEFVIRDRQLEFYSVDGTLRGRVEINAKSTSTERSAAIGYSMDGKIVYVMDQKQIFLVDAENLKKTATIQFDPGSEGESDPGRFRDPRRLPGSDNLLLATREGDIFNWKIGPDAVQRLGKLPATKETRLLEAWPVSGNANWVIAKMNWETLKLRKISSDESIPASGRDSEIYLGYSLATGYIDDTHFIDNSGSNQQITGPIVLAVTGSSLTPVAIFDVPQIAGRPNQFLISGDGSTLVSHLGFEEDLVFKTSEAVTD